MITDPLAVFEWDATSHGHAYALWEKAILSDGGEACRKLCEMSGEPLIEGMLVGTPKDILTTAETHQVQNSPPASSPTKDLLTKGPAVDRRQIHLRNKLPPPLEILGH
jgi:hypothetical protein